MAPRQQTTFAPMTFRFKKLELFPTLAPSVVYSVYIMIMVVELVEHQFCNNSVIFCFTAPILIGYV
jgi:hypothetical protein